jgi:hypothetical protein
LGNVQDRFKGQASAPGWWLGAPFFGVVFGVVANRFFPEFVQATAALIYRASGNGAAPAASSPETTRFLAPLVGMVLAVIALGVWRFIRLVTSAHAGSR